MKKRILLTILVLLITIATDAVGQTLQVIPMPLECRLTDRMIQATDLTTLSADADLQNEADMAREGFRQFADTDLRQVSRKGKVRLAINKELAEEEYYLTVRPGKVLIEGGSPKAVFYGIQTLLQEFNAYQGQAVCGTVHDSPRYPWRGFMLDESRHFFGEQQVKQTLDMMAFYKLNKFHWHLTDAQGWRIEIKAYPQLTTTGAIGNLTDKNAPACYYTQEQIRDIVAYAAKRHIDVIPELDMPGHASAATRAYPELGVEPGSYTYNPAKDSVYIFLRDVIREIARLFPSPYLHIGGDEVSRGNKNWETDALIQQYIREQGLKNLSDVEASFHRRMTPIVQSYGKDLITWDDVLELNTGHLSKVICWWRHDRTDHLYQALQNHYEVVLCPRIPLYFDFVQDSTHTTGRRWYTDGRFNPIASVYAFPESLFGGWQEDEHLQDSILGMQANLWTEKVETQARREFLTYPRLCALAEAAWTAKANKNPDSFRERLEAAYRLFDRLGIYYCDYRDLTRHPEPEK